MASSEILQCSHVFWPVTHKLRVRGFQETTARVCSYLRLWHYDVTEWKHCITGLNYLEWFPSLRVTNSELWCLSSCRRFETPWCWCDVTKVMWMIAAVPVKYARGGGTKAPFVDFSVREIFDLVKGPFRLLVSLSYLTGVTAAELRWRLSNINVIFNKYQCFDNGEKSENNGT